MYRSLLVGIIVLVQFSGSAFGQLDDLSNEEKSKLRACEKQLKSKSRQKQIQALQDLTDMNAIRGDHPHRKISEGVAKALKLSREDNEVRIKAAQLLAKHHPDVAIIRISSTLSKNRSKHLSVYKAYLKNVQRFLKLFEVDTSENYEQNIRRLSELWVKFVESSAVLYDKLQAERAFNEALMVTAAQLQDDRMVEAVNKYYNNMTQWSFRDSLPAVKTLVTLGTRRCVAKVIKDMAEYYDYDAMQAEKEDLEEERDPRAEDFIDWGKEYHDALVTMARERKLGDTPSFGSGVGAKWAAWWEKNQESFPYELGRVE